MKFLKPWMKFDNKTKVSRAGDFCCFMGLYIALQRCAVRLQTLGGQFNQRENRSEIGNFLPRRCIG